MSETHFVMLEDTTLYHLPCGSFETTSLWSTPRFHPPTPHPPDRAHSWDSCLRI